MVVARFEPVVTHFGPWKIPKCIENGMFWDQKWVKHGSKTYLRNADWGPFGMRKPVNGARFKPVVTRFGQWKIPKSLENAPILEPQMGEEWIKNVFFQNGSCTRCTNK